MDSIRFIFLEAIKALGLVFLGLVAVKTVARLKTSDGSVDGDKDRWIRCGLYAVILILVVLGARGIGYDLAAKLYASASEDDLDHARFAGAYPNALRAVELRPGVIRYWRDLAQAKLAQHQFASLLEDRSAFESLGGGEVDEEDVYRFAYCYFALAHYDQVILLTQRLISQNRWYAAPYVLQGTAWIAQKQYSEAEKCFLTVLQMFPNHQAAVEGLAHVYFLEGNRAAAVSLLDQTSKFSFPGGARKRFEALKALYAQ